MNTCLIDSVALRGALPGCTQLFGDEYGSRVLAVGALTHVCDRQRLRRSARAASRPFH